MNEPQQQPDDPWQSVSRPGGDWQGVRPALDNPLSWALPLGVLGGVEVRVHVLFVLYLLIEFLRSLVEPAFNVPVPLGPGPTLMLMASVVLVAILHEVGRAVICRLTGDGLDEVLLWPLGSLAWTDPGPTPRVHFLTACGGLFVHALFGVVLGVILYLQTDVLWEVAIPNPISPLEGLQSMTVSSSMLLMGVFLLHVANMVVGLVNLIPMLPLDGGRLFHAALWNRLGYANAMRATGRLGLASAVVLFCLGFVLQRPALVGVAAVGAWACYVTLRQLEFTERVMSREGGVVEAYAQALRHTDQEDATNVEQRLDELLQKISDGGMASLTRQERRDLETARQHHRQSDDLTDPPS